VSAFGFSPNGQVFVLITYISSAPQPTVYLTLYSVPAGGAVGTSPLVTKPLSWGFSPDDDNRFLLVTSSDSLPTHVDVDIYDTHTGTHVMSDAVTGYSSVGAPAWTAEQDVEDNDSDDDAANDNDQVGGWGFSPDGYTFVLSYKTASTAYVLGLWNLTHVNSGPVYSEFRHDVASFWQFSPCGDLFMLVTQAGANPATSDYVDFLFTSNGRQYKETNLAPSNGDASATVATTTEIQLTGMDLPSIPSPQCSTSVTAHSPVNIVLMDETGRRTGFDGVSGGVVNQIPGGSYTGVGSEPQTVAIPYVAGTYLVDAFGLDSLTSPQPYTLTFATTDASGDVFDQEEVSATATRGSEDTFAFSIGDGPITPQVTTHPCTTARCILEAALMSSACAGQTIPAGVTAKFAKAEKLIDQAASSPEKKARKLLKKAKRALKQAGAKATRAAKGKKPTLSADCAAAITDAADGVAATL